MATIYYEDGLPAELVPVAFLGWAKTPAHDETGCVNVVVKLKRASRHYPTGQVLHVPHRSVVEKSGRRDYFQLVRQAALPAVDTAKLFPARW